MQDADYAPIVGTRQTLRYQLLRRERARHRDGRAGELVRDAQSLRSPELGLDHQGTRRRRSSAKAAFALQAQNEDEAALLRAWRKAQAETDGVTVRVVQKALRRAVRRAREAANPDFTPQRDTLGVISGIRRSLGSIAGSFIDNGEDTQTLQAVLEVERDAAMLKQVALQTLHSQYSDADLGAALGITRQAVLEMRTGSRKGRVR